MAIFAQLLDDVIVHKFDVTQEKTRIGRKVDNDIVIDDAAVSGEHAVLLLEANAFFAEYKEAYIEDLGSTNGTFLNGEPVIGRQRLHNNDSIRIAWNQFKFIDESEEEMEATVHMMRTQS